MSGPSPPRSPIPQVRSPLPLESPRESAVSRLLITPLTFLSFLLSLALIDSHNHSLRTKTHTHSPSRDQPTTFLGRVGGVLHGLVWKEVEQPYAFVRSPDTRLSPGEGSGGRVGSLSARSGKRELSAGDGRRSGEVLREGEKEPWHWHTKQRKMMRAEVEDAFKFRKWVVWFLLLGAVAVMGFVVMMLWLMVRFWGSWEGEVGGRSMDL